MTRARYVGIDVGKRELHVAVSGAPAVQVWANEKAALSQLSQGLAEQRPSLVVVEASGGYERSVVAALRRAKLAVAVVNPTRIKRFAEAKGLLAKTDRLDAGNILDFAETLKPTAQTAP